jgi:hypothetical protein
MLETLLDEGWAYHDAESERLARELEAAPLPAPPQLWRKFLDLSNHTIGEHLADWPRASRLADRLLAGQSPEPATAGAWARLAAARLLAGDPIGALVAETECVAAAADARDALIDCRIAAATALIGSKRVGEGAALYAVVLGLAEASGGKASDRAIAVASNNLASELVEQPSRTAAEDALMRRAAAAGLAFWRRCGTWVQEERALYLLALVANALGEPEDALKHIETSLGLIAANGEEPIDVTFLTLARANALARLGDAEGHRRELAAADADAAAWDNPGLKAWYAEERARIRTL